MKNVKVELIVRPSAATKNLMVALVFAVVSFGCYAFSLTALSRIAIGLAAVFAVMSLTCALDVQEQNMRLLSQIAQELRSPKKGKKNE